MSVFIKSKSGTGWYTAGEISEVRAAIEAGAPLKVWWFAAWGQRFSEELWLSPDELAYIITEHDDG